MEEIKIFREEDYPNFLDRLPDYGVIRKKLEDMRYIAPKRYNENNPYEYDIEVVFNLRIPRFNKALISYIEKYNNIPSEEEFCEYYYNKNREFFFNNNIDDDNHKVAIYNRCMRAYPSLLRDILFGKYLQSKGVKVIHNEILDSSAEIDLMVMGNNGNWGVHLFTNTRRANNHRNAKNYRYQLKFNNVNEIDLEIELSECNKVNNLGLYEDREFEKLKKIVKCYSY